MKSGTKFIMVNVLSECGLLIHFIVGLLFMHFTHNVCTDHLIHNKTTLKQNKQKTYHRWRYFYNALSTEHLTN